MASCKTDKTLRVLFYMPSIDKTSGGVGAYLQLLSRDLGVLCDLHVVTHASADELPIENCTIHYISNGWLPWNSCKREFLALMDSLKPDVFHTNSCWLPLSAMTAMWAKSVGRPVVYTPHGMLEPWIINRNRWKKIPATWLFQRRGIAVSNMIHATSELERQHILALGWSQNVEVIPNCVRVDEIAMKQSWERKRKILFLSRVHEKKGIPILIEAVQMLREKLQGYEVVVAGSGETGYIETLRQMARDRGVAELLNFVGPVYGNDKWPMYLDADVFVLPTYSENFGIVVAEALACGSPVITTHGTPWQELESCRCGWWTAIGATPLAEALLQAVNCTASELEQMGRRGRQLVEERYSSQTVARAFILMYNSLLKS